MHILNRRVTKKRTLQIILGIFGATAISYLFGGLIELVLIGWGGVGVRPTSFAFSLTFALCWIVSVALAVRAKSPSRVLLWTIVIFGLLLTIVPIIAIGLRAAAAVPAFAASVTGLILLIIGLLSGLFGLIARRQRKGYTDKSG